MLTFLNFKATIQVLEPTLGAIFLLEEYNFFFNITTIVRQIVYHMPAFGRHISYFISFAWAPLFKKKIGNIWAPLWISIF